MLETLIGTFSGSFFAVFGPFLLLLLCGLGLPVPEDIILVAAGVLSAQYHLSWVAVSALMYLGILLGDSIIFFVGKYFNDRVYDNKFISRLVSPERKEKVRAAFEKYGQGVLFVGRFLPGLRAPIFFTAGSLKYSYAKFVFWDGLAALVSAPFFVYFGHWAWTNFSDQIPVLEKKIGEFQTYFMLGAATLGAIVFITLWLRSKKNSKKQASTN